MPKKSTPVYSVSSWFLRRVQPEIISSYKIFFFVHKHSQTHSHSVSLQLPNIKITGLPTYIRLCPVSLYFSNLSSLPVLHFLPKGKLPQIPFFIPPLEKISLFSPLYPSSYFSPIYTKTDQTHVHLTAHLLVLPCCTHTEKQLVESKISQINVLLTNESTGDLISAGLKV